MIKLLDCNSCRIRVLELKKSKVVKAIFVFLYVKLVDGTESIKQATQFGFYCFLRARAINVGDEYFACVFDGLFITRRGS